MYGNRLVATSAHFPAIEIDVRHVFSLFRRATAKPKKVFWDDFTRFSKARANSGVRNNGSEEGDEEGARNRPISS